MTPILRPAIRADLDALVELEEVSFDSDWFSRRQLSHLILRAHARTLVKYEKTVNSYRLPCYLGPNFVE